MKSRVFHSFIYLFFILLVCSCETTTLPIAISTAGPSQGQPSSVPQDETPSPLLVLSSSAAPFNIPWDDRSLFQRRLTVPYQGILKQLPNASIYHLEFNFSNPPTSVSGIEEVRYTNKESVSLSEVDFALFPEILGGSIEVINAMADGQPVDPIISKGLMRIPLTPLLEPGRSVVIHLNFSVTVPTLGEDSYYGIFGFNDSILSLAHAYPTILVYNDQGWNNQTPDLDGDPLFSDISFYLVSIDAPVDLTVVASGVEVDYHETAGRQQILFADGPARDFYIAASTTFEKQSESVGETAFNSFAPASLHQFAGFALKTAEAAIDDFSRRYAPYPYTEFNIIPILTSASGVEFPGMIALAKRVYTQSDYLEAVVVHEAGHQWFYNLVGNETQQQPWLDESLAQFVTWQYFFDKYGEQAAQSFRNAIQGRWDKLNDQKIPIGEPVSAYTNDEYGAIIYGRGLFFFLALRQQIGEDAFDSLMQDYTNKFAWEIATSDDFKKLAEQHCNCELARLFQEWVYP